MTDVADLQIKVDSKGVITATRGLKKLDVQSGKTEEKNKKLTKSFSLVKAAATAFASALVIKQFIATAGAFETMKISLEVVTGSAEKATMAFGGILELAKETPFAVSELTEAFIKLKALGLDPSEASLISYGNTASAMGKSLNQMIEAVADAATGEFERLKEFGIKARSQGDNVSFTFQGVTKTVKKNAEDIAGYLQGIGEVQFAGAMSKQMDTINGKISNLGDSTDMLFLKFSEAGAGETFKDIMDLAITGVNGLGSAIDLLPSAFIRMFGAFDKAMAMIVLGLGTAANEVKSFWELDATTLENQRLINAEFNKRIALIDLTTQAAVSGEEKRLAASAGGIDEAGKGGKSKAQSEIEADLAQKAILTANATAFMQLNRDNQIESDGIALDALRAKQEEEANLVLFAQAKSLQDKMIYDEQLIQQEQQKNQAMRNIAQGALGDASALMGAGSKKAFAIGKSFSLGQATVRGFSAATSAWDAGMSTGGPWAPAVAAAYTAASLIKTGVQIKQIKGTQMSGQAHDGMDYIPKTGSYILEQGEAVIKKQEAGKLRAGDVGGGNITFAPVIQAFDADEIGRNKDKLFEGMRNSFIDWMNEEGVRFA